MAHIPGTCRESLLSVELSLLTEDNSFLFNGAPSLELSFFVPGFGRFHEKTSLESSLPACLLSRVSQSSSVSPYKTLSIKDQLEVSKAMESITLVDGKKIVRCIVSQRFSHFLELRNTVRINIPLCSWKGVISNVLAAA